MGQHQPPAPPADEGAAQAAPRVGPRVAAARSRKKRALVLTAATTAVLLVGGTATAAVIATSGDPSTATNATTAPEADPDPLVAGDPSAAGAEQAERAQEAAAAATQSSSSTGDDILDEPEEDDTSTEPESDGSDSGGGSGEDGNCQASYYGADLAGSSTANGESFDPDAMTAAHKTLPFDTMVQVTNPNNGKSVTVRINDRGPFIAGRCLDLSTAAFDQIIGTGAGVGQVDWQVVG